ncbi:Vacuolar protein sorting-associated protein 18 protein [Fasciola gigantica]|uniref:Vacuolar protein sorting-associated protein 18 homolog n=1 Tax=Fasciola gigantica TaxID=46835 RepID=A0A504YS41_FASGI|nr:Vacuolar protein sorting-associated protein 18 protein [Fasciola gigantica]
MFRFFLSLHFLIQLIIETILTEAEITRSTDDRVHNIFLDPVGWHVIISMQSGMNFYTNWGMKKVKILTKAKDMLIDSVAWNKHNTDQNSTQEILIGTNDGVIYETLLISDEGRFISNVLEQYWRQMINLGHSVNGLEVIRFPPGSASVLVGEPQRCVILATTPVRMYQFAGWINPTGPCSKLPHFSSSSPPTESPVNQTLGMNVADTCLQIGPASQTGIFPGTSVGLYYGVFSSDEKLPTGSKVTEFPHSFGYSDLKLYQSREAELPDKFAWMTGPGVYLGYLKSEQLALPPFSTGPSNSSDSYAVSAGNKDAQNTSIPSEQQQTISDTQDVFSGRGVNMTKNTKLLPYPLLRLVERPGTPLGICLTAFHVIIAYGDRVKAVNLVDDRTVCSLPLLTELGEARALGVCRDPVTETVWIFGSQGVAQMKVNNELCRIWQIYLRRGQFQLARHFCQTTTQKDTVNIREAEHCFDQGDFIQSANIFANTSAPFEELALRFSQVSVQKSASLSPVPQGLAVMDDHDVLDAILHGVDGAGTARMPKLMSGACQSNLEMSIAASAPLKTLISSRLNELLASQSKSSDGKPGLKSDKSWSSPAKVSQLMVLTLWLAEILLSELGYLREALFREKNELHQTRLQTISNEFRQLFTRSEVLKLLPDIKVLLYELIESYGNHEEMVFMTELMGDYSRLVDHYMRLGLYKEALNTFVSEPSCLDRMYEHAVTLVRHEPERVVEIWLRLGKRLNPARLLPAILLLAPPHAIRYLQTTVERQTCEQAMHHLLIWLYARTNGVTAQDSQSKDYLFNYLENAGAENLENLVSFGESGNLWELSQTLMNNDLVFPSSNQHTLNATAHQGAPNQTALPFDPGFALRTCKEVGHLPGVIYLLKLMGMHQQALQTALQAKMNGLAKEIAKTETLSKEKRRLLWTELARHVIVNQSCPQEATQLLRESSLLKLEDILPCFHEFVTIDEFKDAICSSLDSYHERIENVRRETKFIMKSMNALRKQLNGLRCRYELLSAGDRCGQCGHVLFTRSFYVFNCGHLFHTNCLIELNGNEIADEDCPRCGRRAIEDIDVLLLPDAKEYEKTQEIWD